MDLAEVLQPGEVLQRLNKDLIDQSLSDTPFITMVYALFNHRDGTLHFSRAGHPYPLHVPRDGALQLWQGGDWSMSWQQWQQGSALHSA